MQIIKFIKGFFNKGQRDADAQMLREWYDESSDTLQAIRTLQDPGMLSDEMVGYDRYNTHKAWEKVQQATASTRSYSPVKRNYYGIAAALLILFTASVVLFRMYNKDAFQPQTFQAANMIQNVKLSDGSEIVLDKESEITEQAFRSLLLKGRAYFKVAEDKDNVFSISTRFGKVEVVGTEFSLWSDEIHSEILVTEGRVRYIDVKGEVFMLEKDDYLIANAQNAIKSLKNKNQYLSWKNQSLKLQNANLEEAIQGLSQHYKANIIIDSGIRHSNCRINTTFTSEKLDEALQELSLIIGLEFHIKENVIRISKVNC